MNRFLPIISVMFAVLLVAGCGSAPTGTSEGEPVKVRIGYQSGWAPNANIGITLDKTDLLQKHGLIGEIVGFQAGPQLSEAILGGRIDIGFQGDGPTMALLARNAPVRILAKLVDYEGQLLVRTESPIQKVADLKGKKVGAMLGTGVYRQLLSWLEAAGLNGSGDVQIINLTPSEMLPALYSGQVEAIASWAPVSIQPVLENRARPIQSGWSRGVLLVTEKFLKEHPEAVVKFLHAYREAIWTMTVEKDQVNQWVADAAGWPVEVVATSALEDRNYREAKSLDDVTVRLTEAELVDLQGLGDFLLAQKVLDKRPDVRAALDLGPLNQVETQN